MSVGTAMKQALAATIRIQGHTVLVHPDVDSLDVVSLEAKGLKTTSGTRSTQVVFKFAEPLDIPVGSVLQAKSSRDYWRVTDTEDVVHDDTFINLDVRVEKVNVSGQPTRPTFKPGDVYNLHGTHARVNVQSQDNSVNVSHQTENVFADMRQLIQTQVADDAERQQILDRLAELEAAKGTGTFLTKYQSFIASAANHMTLLAPFIPALTQMLVGHS